MKPLLFLLLTVIASNAQTLKWSYTPTINAAFEYNNSSVSLIPDPSGGAAVLTFYGQEDFYGDNQWGQIAYQLDWISRNGRLLYSATFTQEQVSNNFHLTVFPNYILFCIGDTFKKVSNVRGRITERDLLLPEGTGNALRGLPYPAPPTRMFFTTNPDTLEVRRYDLP